jgi:hypothetical protein
VPDKKRRVLPLRASFQFSSDILLFPFVLSYTRWSEAYAGRALMRWIWIRLGMVPQSFSVMQESRRRLTV